MRISSDELASLMSKSTQTDPAAAAIRAGRTTELTVNLVSGSRNDEARGPGLETGGELDKGVSTKTIKLLLSTVTV